MTDYVYDLRSYLCCCFSFNHLVGLLLLQTSLKVHVIYTRLKHKRNMLSQLNKYLNKYE